MQTAESANILVVDDRPENLLALQAVLEDLGQNVVTATSGDDALKHLLRQDFAVILLDVQMPDMDGFETAELIRAREKSRNTPIMFVTAINKSNAHVFRGYSMGAVDYLCKPIDPELLKAKVGAFVGLAQESKRLQQEIQRRESAEDDLRRMNDELERRVEERTVQLASANGKLHKEIAERKVLEAALEQRAEALVDAGRRKDEFLAMLAHELRNPLAPILNAVWVLEQSLAADSTIGRQHEIIARQARHLSRLVDDLLDVSRITHGQIELRKEPVELSHVVALAVEAAGPLIGARSHQLSVQMPRDPVWLEGDSARLQQVLSNLLNNAAKYTPASGQIWLVARTEDESAVISVRDTGTGIAPDLLPRVFDLFVQAERSLDRAEAGLGIGLTLVDRLVKLHGGTVEVQSEGPGRGSEFTMRLPLQGIQGPRPPATAEAGMEVCAQLTEETPPRRLKVLVIEDIPDAAEILRVMLDLFGHDVSVASSGPAGVQAALEAAPNVVLCDIGLPGMDGYAVARRMREEPVLAGVFLVALTGYGQEEDRRLAQEAGFDLHLVKPVDPEELERLLANRARQIA